MTIRSNTKGKIHNRESGAGLPRKSLRPGIRQARICEILARKGEVGVDDLARRFNASAETIRRDLTVLAEAGRLRKVHGGARALDLDRDGMQEGAFQARLRQNVLAKQIIAEKAVHLVRPGMVLFVDTGSTTLFAARALARIRRLLVVTNSTEIAAVFAAGSGRAEVTLLGGRYHGGNAQAVGAEAIAQVGLYHADMALLTIGALDRRGAMDYCGDEARLARAMLANADSCTLLADHTKMGKQAAHRVCGLQDIDTLLVDRAPEESLKESLKENRVTLG